MTAWIMFMERHRSEALAANPALDFLSVNKALGEMWKVADAEEKSICAAESQKDKERYNLAIQTYVPRPPEEVRQGGTASSVSQAGRRSGPCSLSSASALACCCGGVLPDACHAAPLVISTAPWPCPPSPAGHPEGS